MVDCPKCGGQFGEAKWQPCFFCGETGLVSEEARKDYELGMEIHNNFVDPDRVWVGEAHGNYDA